VKMTWEAEYATNRLPADEDYFAAVNLKTIRNTMLGSMLNTCGLALPTDLARRRCPQACCLVRQLVRTCGRYVPGWRLAGIIADDNEGLN
jgi:aspartyl-tRNA(Asn)/glutamyl-tRNA(Gln) amidotransferase subunit A